MRVMADEVNLPKGAIPECLHKKLLVVLNGGEVPPPLTANLTASDKRKRLKSMFPQVATVMNLDYIDAEMTPEEAERLSKAERKTAR